MRILLSGNLLRFSNFRRELDVEATTVHAGLLAVVQQCPELKGVLFDGEQQLRGVHRLFLDGEQLDELDTAVDANAELSIVTAIAGG